MRCSGGRDFGAEETRCWRGEILEEEEEEGRGRDGISVLVFEFLLGEVEVEVEVEEEGSLWVEGRNTGKL